MSNNRLAITCAGCKAELWFAKYYPWSGWWPSRDNEELGSAIRGFLEEHSNCREDWPENENAGAFELLYQVTSPQP